MGVNQRTWQTDPRIQAQLDADPEIQRILQGNLWPDPKKKALEQRFRQLGVRMPPNTDIDMASGRLVYEPGRMPWYGWAALPAAFAAPELISALGSLGGGAVGGSSAVGGSTGSTMGNFLETAGKIGKDFLGIGGGGGGKVGTTLKDIAPVIGDWAKSRAKGKEAQFSAEATRSQLEQMLFDRAMQQYGARQNAPLLGAQQAVLGNLLSNMQGGGRFKTGWDYLGPEARQAGSVLAQRGLQSQSGASIPQLPTGGLPKVPKSNFLDKVLGVAGPVAGIGGALGGQPFQDPAQGPLSRTPWSLPPILTEGPFNPSIPAPPGEDDFEELPGTNPNIWRNLGF